MCNRIDEKKKRIPPLEDSRLKDYDSIDGVLIDEAIYVDFGEGEYMQLPSKDFEINFKVDYCNGKTTTNVIAKNLITGSVKEKTSSYRDCVSRNTQNNNWQPRTHQYCSINISSYAGVKVTSSNGGFGSGYVDGFVGGAEATWGFVKGLATFDGAAWGSVLKRAIGPLATAGDMGRSAMQLAVALPDATSYDFGYGAGFVSEKLLEAVILRQASRVNPFRINNGYGFKIGRTEFLYSNPSVGGGTIFSYKSLSGGKFRLDYHGLGTRGNTSHFHTNYWGCSNSLHRSINPFYFGRPIK